MGFADDVKKWTLKVEAQIASALHEVAIEMLTRIVMRSPVDTGVFRGNWQVGINVKPSGVLDEPDTSGAATIARGTSVIKKAKAGDTIFITNNLAYGPALEHGWSKQAPNGMVRVTCAEFPDIVQEALK